MSVTLDKFILQLAEKAGIDAADKRLAEIFAHTEINRVNVNQELVNEFGSNLISVSDATNNHPKIKTHYFGEIMSNIDRVLETVYQAHEFSEDEIKELNKERSSTKRISLVANKLKEKLAAVKSESGKDDDAKDKTIVKLKETITNLNTQIADEKKKVTDKETEFNTKMSDFKKTHAIEQLLLTQKTTFDTLPVDAKNAALRTLIDKKLQDDKVEFYVDDKGNIALRMVEGGANYFDKNNKQVTPTDFISSVLAEAKVLQQSSGANNGQPSQAQPQQGSGTPVVTGQPANGSSTAGLMKSLIDESTKDFANQNPMTIVTGQ